MSVEPLEDRALLSVTLDWVNVLGTGSDDFAPAVALDSSGNVYQSGVSGGQMFLRKASADGTELWSSPLSANSLNLQDVVVDSTNQVYVTGQYGPDPSDIFVAKVDPTNGQAIWTQTMGGTGNDNSQSLAVDGQGNLYVVGAFRGTANFGNGWSLTVGAGADINGFIVKLAASNGQTQWAYRAGCNATSVAVDSSGDIYVGSSVRSANESYFGASANATTLENYSGLDSAVAKYTPSGALAWAKSWAGQGAYDGVRTLATDSNSNLIVALDITGGANLDPNENSINPSTDPSSVRSNAQVTALCKLGRDGSYLWGGQQNVPSSTDYDVAGLNGLAVDASNQIYLASCARTATGPEDWDTRIRKSDGANGAPLWTETIGGPSSDTRPGGVSVDGQGHIFLTGNFTSTTDFDPTSGTRSAISAGANDAYLLRLSQRLDQTIHFDSLHGKTYGDADFAISAAASSGLPVTFTASGDATISEVGGVWTVHLTGVGSALITAHQAGDASYYPAPDVSRAFAIGSPLVVNTTWDETTPGDGLVTLREAVAYANSRPGADTITFDLGSTAQRITLTSGQMILADATTIVGPGADQLTIDANHASRMFYVNPGVTANISGLALVNGRAQGSGIENNGGAIVNNGVLSVSDCRFFGNEAGSGGGAVLNNQDSAIVLTANRCDFVNNKAGYAGGAIASAYYCSINVSNSTFASNYAGGMVTGSDVHGYGGAILSNYLVNLHADHCTFLNNTAVIHGGGIGNAEGNAVVENCTFVGNQGGTQGGGGIRTGQNGGSLIVKNSTIAQNSASYGGGIWARNSGAVLRNTIVAGNTAGGGPDLYRTDGYNIDASYCMIQNPSGAPIAGANNLLNVNPLLGPLGNYGGTTQTIALLPGSPAIDAGIVAGSLPEDQRGIGRVGLPDLGAFESRGFTVSAASGTSQSALVNTAFAQDLVASVASSYGEPVMGGQVLFSAPGSGASAVLSGTPAAIGADGRARVAATANGMAGTYYVAATARGGTAPADFALTNVLPNVPPTVFAGQDTSLDEGGTFSRMSSFSDPDADTWTATVDYGDGSGVQTLTLNPDKTFALSHLYADNGSYTLTVAVADDDGDAGSDTVQIAVSNVAPAVHIARQAGGLDPAFDEDGKLTAAFGAGNDQAEGVAIQPDGKVVVVGSSYVGTGGIVSQIVVARYNVDGSPDTDFGDGGKTTTAVSWDNYAHDVAFQADGKILVAGESYIVSNGQYLGFSMGVLRYNIDGSLDTTFGPEHTGWALAKVPGWDYGHALAVQPDGKIILAGSMARQGSQDFALVRFNPDGTLDSTFGTGGVTKTPLGNNHDTINAVALQPDGKIIVAGESLDSPAWGKFVVARYQANGVLDPDFGTAGITTTSFGNHSDNARGVAVQADGKIVVSGSTTDGYVWAHAVARYNSDGSLDASFDDDGLQTTWFGSGGAVVLQADGKIVVGSGAAGSDLDFGLSRYNSDGSLDASFDGDGMLTIPFGAGNAAADALALRGGTLVLAGRANNGSNDDFALARWTEDLPLVVNEGSSLAGSGSFSDPGADTWTATVDYGDGSGVQPLALHPDKTFALSHLYADNGSYTVIVTVADDDGGAGSDTLTVNVADVAPVVTSPADQTADEGAAASFALGSFADPGSDGPWLVTVTWGDTATSTFSMMETGSLGALQHGYAKSGTYTVGVVVTEDGVGGASGSGSFEVTVNNLAPTVDAGADAALDEGGTFSGVGSFTDPGADTWTATVDYGDGSGAQPLALNPDDTFSLGHLYADAGIYTVTVTVTDSDGDAGSDTLQVAVAELPSLVVTTTDDVVNPYDGWTSLREAIAYANSEAGDDTITLSISGTINLGSALPNLASNINVVGPGADQLTIRRDSGGSYRIFTVAPGAMVGLSGLTISNGSADHGGGIYNAGTLVINGSTVSGNTASNDGGGIYNAGTLEINASLVAENGTQTYSTAFEGGGIYSDHSLTVTNTTVSGNWAGAGAGVMIKGGTATILNCTIASNTADSGGGINNYFNLYQIGVQNTIVAGNVATGGWGPNIGNFVTSAGHNLIGNAFSGGWHSTDLVNVDPLLAPLGDYGGPTETMPLLPGSPALDGADASSSPAVDQRGVGRVGLPDIGALESSGFTLSAASGGGQSTNVGTPFANPLVVAVVSNNALHPEPVEGGQVTFTAPTSGASAILTGTPAAIGVGGQASVTAAANGLSGDYSVSATAAGAAVPVALALTNLSSNHAPVLDPIADPMVDEGSTLSFTAMASDVDNDTLTFSLGSGAPAGATIDAITGQFTWTPAEGPYTAVITVCVTDNGLPALADTKTFTVTVADVAPSDLVLTATPAILEEGGTTTLGGHFTDPGSQDTHTVTIDWDDGSAVESWELPAGTTSFEIAHQYLDNRPGNAPYTITAAVSGGEGSEGDWSSIASMPHLSCAQGGIAAAAIDGKWYMSGAWNGPALQAYDPTTDTWSMKAPIPDNQVAAGGVIDGKLYLAAGCLYNDWSSPTNRLAIYDPASDGWTCGEAAPTARCAVAGAAIGARLYVMGGVHWTSDGRLENFNTLEIYDAASDSWSTGAPLPTALDSSRAEVIGGKIYMVGGFVRDHVGGFSGYTTGALEVYDPSMNTWTTAAPMPTTREGAATAVLDGKLYVAGGRVQPTPTSASMATDVVEVYDPATNSWATAPSLATARWFASGIGMDGKFYVAGGTTNPIYTPVASAEVFAPGAACTASVSLVVDNVAPTVAAGTDATLDEGGTFNVSGSFTDPGADTWTATVDYGDGSGVQALALNPDKTFALSHLYAKDGSYAVSVAVADDDGGAGAASFQVTVRNVAPSDLVLTASPAAIDENDTTTLTGTFADPGTLDTHTVTIDWGDGSTPTAVLLDAGVLGFTTSPHQYLDNLAGDEPYTVTVTVTDDDSASVEGMTHVMVNNVAPMAIDDGAQTLEDLPVVIDVLINDSDPAGALDPLTITGATDGQHGQVTVAGAALTYTPAPDFNGTDWFTYTIDDGDGGTANATVQVTIAPVNDAPLFSRGADVTSPEDAGRQVVAGWAAQINVGPADEASQTLQFLVANSNPALFAVQPAIAPDGTLTFTPAPDRNGVAAVTVRLQDNGGTANGGVDMSASQTFTITVLSAQQQIESLVEMVQALTRPAGPLTRGEANSLTTKLEGAKSLLDRGKVDAAINKIEAFINEVEAKIRSRRLTRGEGEPLIEAANAAIRSAHSAGSRLRDLVFALLGNDDPAVEEWLSLLEEFLLDAFVSSRRPRGA